MKSKQSFFNCSTPISVCHYSILGILPFFFVYSAAFLRIPRPIFLLFFACFGSENFLPAPNQHRSFVTCPGELGNTVHFPLLLAFSHIHSKTACRGFKSFCPCQKTGENTGFSPVFFLHVLHGYVVHFGSNSGFFHPVLPVLNRSHPL